MVISHASLASLSATSGQASLMSYTTLLRSFVGVFCHASVGSGIIQLSGCLKVDRVNGTRSDGALGH